MKISIISALLMCAVFTSCQDDPMVTALQEKGTGNTIQTFNVSAIKSNL